jgi:hypothetical protein
MDTVLKTFPNGLPTLEELKHYNSSDVPEETAWIWGADDEVSKFTKVRFGHRMAFILCTGWANQPLNASANFVSQERRLERR